MTIEITKGKLAAWIIMAAILLCGTGQSAGVPGVAVEAVRHSGFMAEFTGYDDYSLLGVRELRPGIFGVFMLCPAGFHETVVFGCRNGGRDIIYRDMYVPGRAAREKMRTESIPVRDAVRLAAAAQSAGSGKYPSAACAARGNK